MYVSHKQQVHSTIRQREWRGKLYQGNIGLQSQTMMAEHQDVYHATKRFHITHSFSVVKQNNPNQYSKCIPSPATQNTYFVP